MLDLINQFRYSNNNSSNNNTTRDNDYTESYNNNGGADMHYHWASYNILVYDTGYDDIDFRERTTEFIIC